ncbi:hypothetical protein QJS10_CPB20g01760 [Acorus calamus]|uniref:O-acyltransferase WSD1 C-terminal domain-containing protein n=1 Tax=Acorus calamus TaxID=4465 RepID=A0AAV9C855_ACOCL|nr:hypothetical protein QJS10_CPB20g01760 [Acorus calamus]
MTINQTVNDIICGIIFHVTQLYIQQIQISSSNSAGIAQHKGNQFALLHVSVPLRDDLDKIISKVKQLMKRKKSSLEVFLTAQLLESTRRFQGPKSLRITIVSYMGKLKVAMGTERGFSDAKLLTTCMEKASERIYEAAPEEKS